MPRHCSAGGCKSRDNRETRSAGITFHKLPKGRIRRNLWITNSHRADVWDPQTDFVYFCSKHFTPESFELTGCSGIRRLREDAFPTVFECSLEPKRKRPGRPRKQEDVPVRKNPQSEAADRESVQEDAEEAENKDVVKNSIPTNGGKPDLDEETISSQLTPEAEQLSPPQPDSRPHSPSRYMRRLPPPPGFYLPKEHSYAQLCPLLWRTRYDQAVGYLEKALRQLHAARRRESRLRGTLLRLREKRLKQTLLISRDGSRSRGTCLPGVENGQCRGGGGTCLPGVENGQCRGGGGTCLPGVENGQCRGGGGTCLPGVENGQCRGGGGTCLPGVENGQCRGGGGTCLPGVENGQCRGGGGTCLPGVENGQCRGGGGTCLPGVENGQCRGGGGTCLPGVENGQCRGGGGTCLPGVENGQCRGGGDGMARSSQEESEMNVKTEDMEMFEDRCGDWGRFHTTDISWSEEDGVYCFYCGRGGEHDGGRGASRALKKRRGGRDGSLTPHVNERREEGGKWLHLLKQFKGQKKGVGTGEAPQEAWCGVVEHAEDLQMVMLEPPRQKGVETTLNLHAPETLQSPQDPPCPQPDLLLPDVCVGEAEEHQEEPQLFWIQDGAEGQVLLVPVPCDGGLTSVVRTEGAEDVQTILVSEVDFKGGFGHVSGDSGEPCVENMNTELRVEMVCDGGREGQQAHTVSTPMGPSDGGHEGQQANTVSTPMGPSDGGHEGQQAHTLSTPMGTSDGGRDGQQAHTVRTPMGTSDGGHEGQQAHTLSTPMGTSDGGHEGQQAHTVSTPMGTREDVREKLKEHVEGFHLQLSNEFIN